MEDNPMKIWAKAVVLDTFSSQMAIHEWTDDLGCSQLEYIKTIVDGCKQIFDRTADPHDKATWPIPEDPETAFAHTIVADGSGIAFQSTFANSPEDRIQPRSKRNPIIADPQHLLHLWKIYNAF